MCEETVVWMKAREWESDGWGMGRRRSCVRQCQRLWQEETDGVACWTVRVCLIQLTNRTNNGTQPNVHSDSLWTPESGDPVSGSVSNYGKKTQMEVCETCCVCVNWEEGLLDMIDRAIPKMFWGHSICQRLKQEAIDGEAGQYECARVFACQE